jgi:hypothetical protein
LWSSEILESVARRVLVDLFEDGVDVDIETRLRKQLC